jgi:hypothetical protein
VLNVAQALSEAFDRWRDASHAHSLILKQAEGINSQVIPTMSPAAADTRGAVERMLMAQDGQPVAGSNGLPLPAVPDRELRDFRVRRGEGEWVEDGHAVKFVETPRRRSLRHRAGASRRSGFDSPGQVQAD